MQGTVQKERDGYHWMRIGFAPPRFACSARLATLLALIVLGIWFYVELPKTVWRPAIFVGSYFASAILYLNLGVWLHEQLHGLGFRGRGHAKPAHITYERKHLLILGGFYEVHGGVSYRVASSALLGPLWLTIGLLLLACLGLLLPGWWLPLMLSFVTVSLLDMVHDLYMYSQIQSTGSKGKYWDRGKVMEAVWKD